MSAAGALVLASGSPRRREILTTLGIAFEVRPTGADETPRAGEKAVDLAKRIARAKCESAVASAREGDAFFLAADTVVDVDGLPLNKPEDDADAARMLRSLSGRSHFVHTACALGGRGAVEVVLVSSEVVFRALDDGMIARYVASGEGRDKAGAYALQGLGGGLVTEVRGSPSNVIGLPAAETIDLLVRHGVIAAWPL
jgi:septum formation protein